MWQETQGRKFKSFRPDQTRLVCFDLEGTHQIGAQASGRISTSRSLILRCRWLRSIFKSSAVREMFQ